MKGNDRLPENVLGDEEACIDRLESQLDRIDQLGLRARFGEKTS